MSIPGICWSFRSSLSSSCCKVLHLFLAESFYGSGDQLRLTTDRFRQDRIPPTYTFTFMGVTSSGCQLSIFLCKLHRSGIGLRCLTTVKSLYKIKTLDNLRWLVEFSCMRKTHILFTAWMCRSKNSAITMNQIDQQRQRHSPHFQQTDLNSFRHDHQDMTRITRIIFNPFQYNKICMLLSFDILFPVTVSVIRIMIRDYPFPWNPFFFRISIYSSIPTLLSIEPSLHDNAYQSSYAQPPFLKESTSIPVILPLIHPRHNSPHPLFQDLRHPNSNLHLFQDLRHPNSNLRLFQSLSSSKYSSSSVSGASSSK